MATLAGVLLGAEIPDPAVVGIDIIFPAAMIGLAVGLITGRRELVAAIVGASIAVVVALLSSPSIGIVAGGVLGPVAGLLTPADPGRETARLGTAESAERYSMPGARGGAATPIRPSGSARPQPTRHQPSRRPDEYEPRVLAILMFAVTYPSRALGLLTPGLDRLPKFAFDYLQLVGPAVLGGAGRCGVMVTVNDAGEPSFHVGIEWVAVFVCLAIVGRTRNLLVGLVAAVAIVAIARALGLAAMP